MSESIDVEWEPLETLWRRTEESKGCELFGRVLSEEYVLVYDATEDLLSRHHTFREALEALCR